jgi:CRP-like cAMP-binding protein
VQHRIVIKTLLPGDCFGVREFFTGEKRIYGVRTREFSTLLKIRREDFLAVVRQVPDEYEKFCFIKDGI